MKRLDIFCSSPASTAICSSLEQRSMVRRSHKPIFDTPQQSPRTRTTLHDHRQSRDHHQHLSHVPCSSQVPISPRPHLDKSRKSTSSSYSTSRYNTKQACSEVRRKSYADILDLKSHRDNSSRYLLGESRSTFVLDWLPESTTCAEDRVRQLVAASDQPERAKFRSLSSNGSSALIKSSSTNRSRHQVYYI